MKEILFTYGIKYGNKCGGQTLNNSTHKCAVTNKVKNVPVTPSDMNMRASSSVFKSVMFGRETHHMFAVPETYMICIISQLWLF